GVDGESLPVRAGEFHDEVVGDQGAPLSDDRGAFVHLALHVAGDLDGLELRLEGSREGAFDHPLEPALEALKHSHEVPPLTPRPDEMIVTGLRPLLLHRTESLPSDRRGKGARTPPGPC